MNKRIILFLFTAFALLPGCKKNAAVDIKEWTQFQDQFFKVSFNYPKDWVVVTESKAGLLMPAETVRSCRFKSATIQS